MQNESSCIINGFATITMILGVLITIYGILNDKYNPKDSRNPYDIRLLTKDVGICLIIVSTLLLVFHKNLH